MPEDQVYTTIENNVRRFDHIEVPMPDGTVLAARLWLPGDAAAMPCPAILEYLPYRKNDMTAARDASMQPYLAANGYAVIRLDMRGAGDSEGLMEDEYLPQELQDGVDAIAWIAAQDWCDGNVGMIGISWGGFNGLQIAALQPPALKAVISLCSTDDRYADDIHYQGGCLLGEQLSWASIMFGRNTLPPDPKNVGDTWRQMWRERLDGSGLWLKNWLQHQRRDAFWQHGSICEDWSKVHVPVYAVSGWADGYFRAVFRLMENLPGPRKGLIGPWAHRYPHIGAPGPAIGFLAEEIRWWDHWLKGRDTGIMAEPMLRLYQMDSVLPAGVYHSRPGRWIAEPSWPSPNVTPREVALSADGRLGGTAGGLLDHASPADVGMASGKWCGYAMPGDAPIDQRRDDAGSLCFETERLEAPLSLSGEPVLHLRLAADQPVAQIAARLVDVAPDGQATRLAFGVLNLTHREGHAAPKPLEPGTFYEVRVELKHLSVRLSQGHRLRLALSSSYFPMIWPTPVPARLTLDCAASKLILPERAPSPADEALHSFGPAEVLAPFEIEVIDPPQNRFEIVEDAAGGATEMRITDGAGTIRHVQSDITLRSEGRERYRIRHDDPSGAEGWAAWEYGLSRDDWQVSSHTETHLHGDKTDFIVTASQRVFEGETLIDERDYNERIPRDLM